MAVCSRPSACSSGRVRCVPLPAGTWVHLACISDESGARLMVDGKLAAGVNIPQAPLAVTTAALRIGCGGQNCGNVLTGALIDRVRLWNIAVDDATLCDEADCE